MRYVDSSVERLQVKVRGLTARAHVVACNGRRVPLHPTGTERRIRRRRPLPRLAAAAACTRPSRPPPLVFDIVDTWNGRSPRRLHLPRGASRRPNYETFPVNAYEAESRRLARFFRFGHTPGPDAVPPAEPAIPQFPFTLDLRRGVIAAAVQTAG